MADSWSSAWVPRTPPAAPFRVGDEETAVKESAERLRRDLKVAESILADIQQRRDEVARREAEERAAEPGRKKAGAKRTHTFFMTHSVITLTNTLMSRLIRWSVDVIR